MALIIGVVLVILGLVIGFIVAWALGAGASMNLFVGLVLVAAGAIVGFISEWLIDEAYRKNRELVRQLNQRGTWEALAPGSSQEPDAASTVAAEKVLADFLRERDEDVRQLREQLEQADTRIDAVRAEFDSYQQTHPDDLTVIKGIGPVYQWKLRDAGINSYAQLATADPAQLRRMLDIKNWQRVDIEGWITQARDWAQRDG